MGSDDEEDEEACSFSEAEESSAEEEEQEDGSNSEEAEDAGNVAEAKPFQKGKQAIQAVGTGTEDQRKANIRAMLSNNLQTQRAPVMSRYLLLQQSDLVIKRAFVSPMPGTSAVSEELRRKLVARRTWVPWGSKTAWAAPAMTVRPSQVLLPEPPPPAPPSVPPPAPPVKEALPEGIEPLVLWAPPDVTEPTHDNAVVVDTMLVKWLRPHQREGVAFMFECVTGMRVDGGQGCILADDMGLGKTLQGLTLLWTLSTSGHDLLGGRPMAKRSLIVCPTSLVGNWATEAKKWLNGRLAVLALCEASREDVATGIAHFLHPSNPYKVLILSYETFRINSELFRAPGSCDLLICDEAHRLKNEATLTNRALDSLPCRRRVLLSGTPMQNHLDEFFAMVDFCNPGVLGTPSEFRRRFESPILAGREPGAAPEVMAAGEAHSAELSRIVNAFILRRTNTLLSAHLPPKVVMVVCCKLTQLQRAIYRHFLESKAARKILGGKGSNVVLPAISNLKKLCNHPKLIYDAVHSRVAEEERKAKGSKATAAVGFEGVASLFPPCLFDDGRPGRGGMAIGWEGTSGKFGMAARMLAILWEKTDDKIVLVSNYTQTLDLFGQLCRERSYPVIRLDGSTSVAKREKLVQAFNDPCQRNFIFLLSSKAGGCGLNLVGANRLMLFDCDWNPAVDKQAAARVWRDGQQRRVYVYRLVATGTIEEKVFQRQLNKEGLQSLVSANNKTGAGGGGGGGGAGKNLMSADELRELFTLHENTPSHTWEVVRREARAQERRAAAAAAAAKESQEEGGEGEEGPKGEAGGSRRAARSSRRVVLDGDSATESGSDEGEVVAMELDGTGGDVRPTHIHKEQQGSPSTEEELAAWGHHTDPATVPDLVLQRCAGDDVSFVFSCQVAGKAVEETVFQPRAVPGIMMKAGIGRRATAGVKRPAPQSASTHTAPPITPPAPGQPTGTAHAQPNPSAIASNHLPAASIKLPFGSKVSHAPWKAPVPFTNKPPFANKPPSSHLRPAPHLTTTLQPSATAPLNSLPDSNHLPSMSLQPPHLSAAQPGPLMSTPMLGQEPMQCQTASTAHQKPIQGATPSFLQALSTIQAAQPVSSRGDRHMIAKPKLPVSAQAGGQGGQENTIVLLSDDE